MDIAPLDLHVGPHGHKALDVLVDGPVAQMAAAGQRDLRRAEAAQQGPDQVVGGPDFPGHVQPHLFIVDAGAVDIHGGTVHRADVGAQLL